MKNRKKNLKKRNLNRPVRQNRPSLLKMQKKIKKLLNLRIRKRKRLLRKQNRLKQAEKKTDMQFRPKTSRFRLLRYHLFRLHLTHLRSERILTIRQHSLQTQTIIPKHLVMSITKITFVGLMLQIIILLCIRIAPSSRLIMNIRSCSS